MYTDDSDLPCPIDRLVSQVLETYLSTPFRPPLGQFTILASLILTRFSEPLGHLRVKPISIATGTKCLPALRLPLRGEAVHDSHAEILARRGAVRWFLDEIGRCQSEALPYESEWITQASTGGGYVLQGGVRIYLYISTVPCGDASTRYLAAFQDEDMAALKNANSFPATDPGTASRGRDNYALLGVLRTKPGRADSPPSLSMSCSDKIAAWNLLGFQGALASLLISPLHVAGIIIGEVPSHMQDMVMEDCERALWRRLCMNEPEWPYGYTLHKPRIYLTNLNFKYSRTAVTATTTVNGSCNESLCWTADAVRPTEILINGLKRGVSPKHRYRDNCKPQISKIVLFQQCNQMLSCNDKFPDNMSYREAKATAFGYQKAKQMLHQGPIFSGWVKSAPGREEFLLNGEYREGDVKHR